MKQHQWCAFTGIPKEDGSVLDGHLLALPFLKRSHVGTVGTVVDECKVTAIIS